MQESMVSAQPEKKETPAVKRQSGMRRVLAQPLLRNLVVGLVALVLFYLLIGHLGQYRIYQLSLVGPYVIALVGLSVLTGQNGQISLGHGALMAIGAWTLTLLQLHTKTPLWMMLIAAALVTMFFGALLGLVAARLRGPYLAGATLALALGLPDITTRYQSVFGGYQGLEVNQPNAPSFLGAAATPTEWLALIEMVCVVVVMVLFANLLRSRVGRNFRAVRDDEIATQVSGISVPRTQVLAFALSAAAAGLAGGLFALVAGNVSPGGFSVVLSISLLAAMVIGGTGTLAGAVWGALIMVYVPEWATTLTQKLNLNQAVSANLALAIYGFLLVAIIMIAPVGIQGLVRVAIFKLKSLRKEPG
ncbi:MAG: branched-chain amino acid ABC transporter permease [Actinomycetota bacterium]|nr:branched-chain amino acid ABC transporter permease [Actinomycetota bacterium]